jgi:hypothetical protein
VRVAGLLVIVACGAPSQPTTPSKPRGHPCDSAHWSELAQGALRVWPANASAPAHLVEVAGANVEVASVTSSVITTRWMPYASLRPVASAPSKVSPTPGAEGDSALRILVGHPLEPPVAGWAAVDHPRGYVPTSIAGVMWTEQALDADDEVFATAPLERTGSITPHGPVARDPVTGTIVYRSTAPRDPSLVERSVPAQERRFLRYATGEIRSAPADDAPIRIALTEARVIQVRAGVVNDFLVVTVFLPFAEIDGYWKRPVPKPRTTEDEVESEMGYEVAEVHSPIAPGTCLYDAPRGRVVGIVREADAFAKPTASTVAGWYTATIPTIWGSSTYYIDTPPLAPPSPAPTDEWRWKESWTNEW